MKRQYNLYLDIETIEILKSEGMDNISSFINALLSQEAKLKQSKGDDTLKLINAKLMEELNEKNKELEKANIEIKKLKEKQEIRREKSGFKPIVFS